ncbi:hypothetical protein JCM3770_005722 [Rhodotorula araucariae]
MPPDRNALHAHSGTASRFSQALETGAPLSSVGAAHPPSLERGKACLTCRRRRVKCDGMRPVCGRCAKSARAHGEDPTSFVCVYDAGAKLRASSSTPSGAGAGASAGSDAGAIAELAAQVAALKQQLQEQQQQQQQAHTSPSAAQTPSAGFDQPMASTSSLTLDVDPAAYFAASASGATPAPYAAAAPTPSFFAASAPPSAASTSLVWTPSLSMPYTAGGSDLTDLATAASPLYQQPLPSLYWGALTTSSYPPDLPSPALFARLVDAFFLKPHLASGLINERRFRASLAFLDAGAGAEDDPRAPAPCLLHAIVATAALLVPAPFYASEPRYWAASSSLAAHHAKRAEGLLDAAFQRGRQLLQVVQASVLCVFCAYTDARFGDIWLVSAMTSRLAVTVGLNHVRRAAPSCASASAGDGGGDGAGNGIGVGGAPARTEGAHRRQRRIKEKSMLAPARDAEEVAERASVFCFAFAADKMTSAATGWAAAIDEDDVTTLLPHPPCAEDTSDDPLSSPLYLHNPSFFFANPPHLTHAPQLVFKAYILLGRVVRFLQRAPEPVGSGWPRDNSGGAGYGSGEDLRDTPAFRALARTIAHFRLSIPRELTYAYYASHRGIENAPLLVFTLLHVLDILMHEPFCLAGPDPRDGDGEGGAAAGGGSFAKCLAAAKAIVASVYELSGSSFEIGLLASFLNYLWAVAGRTLVRALALASRRGDLGAAAMLASDVKALIGAMQANRSRVGAVTALNLQRLLLHPFQVLHESFTGPPPGASMRPGTGAGASAVREMADEGQGQQYVPPAAATGVPQHWAATGDHQGQGGGGSDGGGEGEGEGDEGQQGVWELFDALGAGSGTGAGAGAGTGAGAAGGMRGLVELFGGVVGGGEGEWDLGMVGGGGGGGM